MTPAVYECGLFALKAYQGALSDNVDEILCVACVLRNRVQRLGKTYTQVLEESEVNRPWPSIQNPALIDPQTGLLAQIEDVYRNIMPDLTSNHNHKNGAMYFCEVMHHQGTGDWVEENILKKPEEHCLIGKWGSQHFYE